MSNLESSFWSLLAVLLISGISYQVGVESERAHGIRLECAQPEKAARPQKERIVL